MNRVRREIVRNIRYATDTGLIILSFALEELPNDILPLQNALNTLTLSEMEIIITRSLFDLTHNTRRVYTLNDLSVFETPLLQTIGLQEVIISRTDHEDHVHLEYRWI